MILSLRRRFAIVAACFSAACAGAGDRPPAADSATVVQAPEYSAVTLEGDTLSLASYRGEVVLLNLWATWCPPCREEMPYLQILHEKNAGRGFQVVGVSIDAAGEEQGIRSFLDEHRITFPIWLDPDDRASFVFRAIGVPASFLIDRDGQITWKLLGPVSREDTTLTRAIEVALARGGG
jgi:cytochrome c-type biogenesis protein